MAGKTEETAEPLERLRSVAPDRPNSEAFLAWAEGLVSKDPARLRAAVETFERLGRVIDEARCLMDIATLRRSPGTGDGTAEDERARQLLAECGMSVFAPIEAL